MSYILKNVKMIIEEYKLLLIIANIIQKILEKEYKNDRFIKLFMVYSVGC